MTTMKPTGVVLYEGPSQLDGQPIIVVATGLRSKSTNSKTGGMVQTYILRSDVHPVEAVHSGADESICGAGDDACPLRPKVAEKHAATCYVNKGFGPAAVFRGYQRGIYPYATQEQLAEYADGRPLRIGAYGDPAAAPPETFDFGTNRTGYTHQWRKHPELKHLVMASVGSEEEALEAQALGWRTFRVRTPVDALLDNEIICPASEEGGHKTQCESCGLCNGMTAKDQTARAPRKSITIIDHGPTTTRKRTVTQ